MLVLAHLENPSRKTCPVCVSMLVLAHLEDPSRKTCPVCVSMLGMSGNVKVRSIPQRKSSHTVA